MQQIHVKARLTLEVPDGIRPEDVGLVLGPALEMIEVFERSGSDEHSLPTAYVTGFELLED